MVRCVCITGQLMMQILILIPYYLNMLTCYIIFFLISADVIHKKKLFVNQHFILHKLSHLRRRKIVNPYYPVCILKKRGILK